MGATWRTIASRPAIVGAWTAVDPEQTFEFASFDRVESIEFLRDGTWISRRTGRSTPGNGTYTVIDGERIRLNRPGVNDPRVYPFRIADGELTIGPDPIGPDP